MRRRSLLRIRSVSYGGCWSMRLKRRPLLQTSSPLNHQLRTYIGIGTANGGTSVPFAYFIVRISGHYGFAWSIERVTQSAISPPTQSTFRSPAADLSSNTWENVLGKGI